jgi:hypothetical protein
LSLAAKYHGTPSVQERERARERERERERERKREYYIMIKKSRNTTYQ